ncbi:hypothetical protein MMC26_000867 [Xylographa opegraphella]|nr:hypothetical protein [Xylographa opegraphella]
MEVFCLGLPEQTTDAHLKKSFLPVLNSLSIYTFHCRKMNKGLATLTIGDAQKAQKLLDRYGSMQGKRRPPKQQLKLFGRPVTVTKSRNNPPDEFLLRSLEEEEAARIQRIPRLIPSTATKSQKSFAISSFSCGLWDYMGQHAVFVDYFRYSRHGTILFGKSSLNISMPAYGTFPELEIEYDYSSIHGSIYLGKPFNPTVTISLAIAPRLYEITPSADDIYDAAMLAIQMNDLKVAVPTIPTKKRVKSRIDSLGKASDAVAATCFTYQFVLNYTADLQLILALKERQIPKLVSWKTSTIPPPVTYCEQLVLFVTSLAHQEIPYQLKYQLQMLVWNGILSPDKVNHLISTVVQFYRRVGVDLAVHCIQNLAKKVQYAGPEADQADFELGMLAKFILGFADTGGQEAYLPYTRTSHPNGTWIHRATVTPLGIYLTGPYWESKNRILRRYPDHTDYFMRVEFMEETGDPIRFEQDVSLDHIFKQRFRTVLINGFFVGDRHFEFLGFSHSSLRSQSCWFMAAFTTETGEPLDARSIIRTLGDFSHIRSPAKCAARIGQALSETVPSVDVDLGVVELVDDIERNSRVFSDGVGTVSQSLIEKIWEKYAVRAKIKPTVIQIRFAGAKGMISLDTTRSGDVLMLRKSMRKFEAPDAFNIEICGSGIRPLPLRLNRQLIKILEDLGVSEQPLLDLQQEEVDELRETAQSPILAANFLEKANLATSAMIPTLVRTLVRLQLNFLNDQFLRHMIELSVLVKLRELKYRARIYVPQGFTLHGIMDETGFLREGEVYCPIIDDTTGRRKVLVGANVAITRSPALHPGDIQLVNAVNVPDESPLNGLHNCVVFSQRGSRDLPSKLSGGDLDGDLYNIIYDERLKPKRVVEAADYPRVEAISLDRPVERPDIIHHFLTFMQQDQLGRIATLHQSIADQKKQGTFDQECLTLAELHSTAVDYSKTGIPADISRLPKNKRLRPDFMATGPRVEIAETIALADSTVSLDEEEGETSFYRYYKSKKVLGLLYRAIDEQAFMKELQNSTKNLNQTSPAVFESLCSYILKKCKLTLSATIPVPRTLTHISYEDNLINLMYQYSPTPWASTITELEVFIGNIVGKTHGQTKRQREASMNMRADYERLVEFIVSQIRNKEAGRQEALERSIACMALGLEDDDPVRRGRSPVMSFRWIAASVCLQEVERLQKSTRF